MNKANVAFFLVGLLCASHAACSDLVKFPSGPAAWTVEVKDSQISESSESAASTPARGPKIVSVAFTQDEEKRRSVETLSDNSTKEKWDFPKMFLVIAQDPDGTPFAVMNGGLIAQTVSIPFIESDFQWVQPGCLQEKDPISYHGMQCFHYKGHRPAMQGALVLPDSSCEAWIDSKTLRPVALDTGTMLGVFTYQKDPPPTPLKMPAAFQAKLDRWEMCLGIVKPSHQ